ncbi:hypothetical protein EJ02DRAFT_368140 [Clathrospora elynae]|uniref:Uncharacterized protein n=1 Tax=Clathrospora elynae TaxID=706981 RepID=A0A6A5SYW2_9PLEO|nr:hypothetical protein EJ02DRAFT_368140 [Clathrospora elynae]
MATTNAAPTGQEQPKAPVGSGNPNLDTLQSSLNLIFMNSGRFLKEAQAGGGTSRMKLQLQHIVPIATERFHDALDELENEVRLAQTVLRRDMAILRQDRKKRETAAKQQEVEKARLAAESRNTPARTDEAPMKMESAAPSVQPEALVVPEAPAQVAEPEEILTQDKEEIKTPPPPIETKIEPPIDPLFDGTPTTGNPQDSEFDFDAMFGDAMDTSGDNNHDDMMDTSGNLDFNLDDGNEGPSLLRGLEDFAKDSDDDNANHASTMDIDFAMPDLPDLNTTTDAKPALAPAPEPAPTPTPTPKAEEARPAPQPPPGDVKKAATNEDDMMTPMAAEDLEDLFNMDEYENPEQTSFDDAFFNFE